MPAQRWVALGLSVVNILSTGAIVLGWPGMLVSPVIQPLCWEAAVRTGLVGERTGSVVIDVTLDCPFRPPQLMLAREDAILCEDGSTLCEARDLELNLVFSVANVALLLSSLPLGLALERFGPKLLAFCSNLVIAAGSFVIAAGFDGSSRATDGATSSGGMLLLVGLALVSASGPGIQLATVGVSELFPSRRATVVGLLSGMMGGSALVLPLYGAIHSAGGGSVTIRGIFWWHGGMALALAVAMAAVLPWAPFEAAADAAASPPAALDDVPSAQPGGEEGSAISAASIRAELKSRSALGADQEGGAAQSESAAGAVSSPDGAAAGEEGGETPRKPGPGGSGPIPPRPSLLAALCRPWFLFLVVWFAAQYLRLVLYLGTAELQLREIAAAAGRPVGDVSTWLAVLGWLAPLGALAAPLSGLLQDAAGYPAAVGAVTALGVAHAAMSLVPSLEAQPLTFVLYTCQQEALFGVVLAGILDGMGPARVGVGAGIIFVCGAACSAVITPVTEAIVRAGSFVAPNVALLAVTCATAAFPIAMACGVRSLIASPLP